MLRINGRTETARRWIWTAAQFNKKFKDIHRSFPWRLGELQIQKRFWRDPFPHGCFARREAKYFREYFYQRAADPGECYTDLDSTFQKKIKNLGLIVKIVLQLFSRGKSNQLFMEELIAYLTKNKKGLYSISNVDGWHLEGANIMC